MIKSKVLGTVLLFVFCNKISSQYEFGLKSGLDLVSIYSKFIVKKNCPFPIVSHDLRSNYRLSYQLGLFFNIPFSERTGLEIEPGFIEKGSINNVPDSSHMYDNRKLGYLDMPILFNYRFFNIFKFELGPEIGYRLYYKENGGKSYYYPDKIDISANIGFCIEIEKSNVGLRFSHEIINQKHEDLYFIDKQYNRYFELFVRYLLIKK